MDVEVQHYVERGTESRSLASFRSLFEKDLEFYQLLLVLVNGSIPIKPVELVWVENGPAWRVGLRQQRACTQRALDSRCADLVQIGHLPPKFCQLVNDYGNREAESCAISDKEAERTVGKTCATAVYRCHAGLTEIAVPVVADGHHIATLFAGQAVQEPHSQANYEAIRRSVSRLSYIDWDSLEKAYWELPLVTQGDIDRSVMVLEIVAQHIAGSWTRLLEIMRDQKQNDSERRLCRKELAHTILDGSGTDVALRELMRKIGLAHKPNRAMTVQLEPQSGVDALHRFEITFSRGLEAAETFCDTIPNTCCAHLSSRGFCVFFHDESDQLQSLHVGSLAARIRNAIHTASGLQVRIGIGSRKEDWATLAESHREACVALTESSEPIAVYRAARPYSQDLATVAEDLCRLLGNRSFSEARARLQSLPLLANRELGKLPGDLKTQRQFYWQVLNKLCYESVPLGLGSTEFPEQADLTVPTTLSALQDAFVAAGERVIASGQAFFTGRREKLVKLACRELEHALNNPATAQSIRIADVAASLGISTNHLTRLFRSELGVTFEGYLMRARVAAAQRMLLEPLATVSEVAERCGFSDPTYFARVFRKITGHSPSAFRNDPVGAVKPFPSSAVTSNSAHPPTV